VSGAGRRYGLLGPAVFLALAAGLALLAPLVAAPLDWHAQAWLGAAFLVFAMLVNRLSRARLVTYLLMTLSLVCTLRYAYWRTTSTLGIGVHAYHWYDLTVTALLFAAEVYAWVVLLLGFVQTARPLKRKPVSLPRDPADWPSVDVYIPTYNESLDVVRATVLAALQMDWPADRMAVYVLDDGVREEFREFAAEVGAGYITRSEHKHAKAGNLNHAMSRTHGEYIAIFDCDHVPTRSFLQTSMGWFLRDRRLALVQTPHHFYSPDPFERNLRIFKKVPSEGELFYGVVQDGNDLWNACFFCGSCAVMRREALEEVGGIATETVTEDAHTSLKLQRRGWNSAYLNVPLAAGLATESFSGHIGQRVRWARGMAQIMRMDNPLAGRGLKFSQRLCYLNAMLHFFFALPRLVFLIAPLFYLYFGIYVISAYAFAIAAYALPHLALATIVNSRIQGRHRHSFWNEVYETALAPYILLPTLLAIINPKLGKFNVTAKGGLVRRDYFDRRIARPFVVLFMLNVGGIAAAALRWILGPHVDYATILMTGVWTLYNLLIICVVLAVNWETRQVRERVRVPLRAPAILYWGDGRHMPARTADISESGVRLEAVMNLPESKPHEVGIVYDGAEHRFPVDAVTMEGNDARLRFTELDHHSLAELVKIIYGRANAWLGWGESRNPDRPWRSLLQLARLSLLGAGRLLRGLRQKPDSAPDADGDNGSARARGTALSAMLVLLAVAGLAAPAHAAPAAKDAAHFARHYTLASLGQPSGLRLHGTRGIHEVALSIPPNEVVSKASMTLRYRVSPGLIARISQINVLVNGQVIRSVPVGKHDDAGRLHTVHFAIKPELLGEYNHVGFQLIGHYTMQCENPENSTLWARISPDTRIETRGARLAVSNNLSLLPAPFFYPSFQQRLKLPFVFQGIPARQTLEAAGVLASWFGDLASFRGADFPVRTGNYPAHGNAVVFATASELPASANLPPVTGPTVAVTANPRDPYGKLLWVLGDTPQDLVTAARALAIGSNLLTGPSAAVPGLNLPPRPKPDTARRWVPSSGPVRLSALANWHPMTVHGSGSLDFSLHLPPSLFLWERQGIPMHLHYGYSSLPIAANSSLNIAVNGSFVRSLPLPPGKKQRQQRHALVHFPASTLNPNTNAMTSSFYFVPVKGKCKQTNVGNARGVIYPDSTVNLSGIPHYAHMPDLSLWINGGYPFTRYADLSNSAVILPQAPGRPLLHAYLNLLGRFGSDTGQPALRMTVAAPNTATHVAARNLVVLTPPGGAAMQRFGQALPLTYRHDELQLNNLTGWFAALRWKMPWTNHPPQRMSRSALGKLVARGVQPSAVIEEGISPLHDDRTVLLASAQGQAGWERFRKLLDDETQPQHVFGNLSVLHGTAVNSFILDTPGYHVGHLPLWTRLRYWFSRNVWALWLAAIVLAVVIALLTRWLLRRRARRRLARQG